MKKFLFFVSALACLTALQAQNVTVQDAVGQSPEAFVRNHLMGSEGVYVFNVKHQNAEGDITMPQIGTFQSNGAAGIYMDSGIVMTSTHVTDAAGPSFTSTPVTPYHTDPDMDSYRYSFPGNFYQVTSCSTLDFDFVCLSDEISIQYTFGSNQYSQYTGSPWDDICAIFLTGPDPEGDKIVTRNIALVPGSVTDSTPNGLPVSLATINNGNIGVSAMWWGVIPMFHPENSVFYYDNSAYGGAGYYGLTSKLTAEANIVPGQVYHMHISVCSVGQIAACGLYLGSNSFTSPSAQIGLSRYTVDTVPGRCGLSVPLSLVQTDAFDYGTVHFDYGGTAVYGTDYELVDERGRALDSTGLAIDNEEHSFVVRALPGADLSEPKSIELYLLTSLCPQFPELVTHDTMRFVLVRGGDVQVADTTITCSQACFEVSAPLVYGDESTTYRWEPTTGLADPYSLTTAAAIFESADYQLIATGGSGCNSDTAQVHVVVTGNTPEPPVGIEDEVGGRKSEVSVWPNPANDVIHIEAEGLQRVELYSLDGRLVASGQVASGRISLPTEGLANGTYGLRIVTAEGTTASKIVVNK